VALAALVAIDYEDEVRAEEVRLALLKMQKEYLIDLADAVVVRDAKGKGSCASRTTSPSPARSAAACGGADRAAVPESAVRLRPGGGGRSDLRGLAGRGHPR
jgi:hypothetical protein